MAYIQECDILVVGAGPGGLAVMARAKEKGLKATCVEVAIIGKKIYDYAAEKPVKQEWGLRKGEPDTIPWPEGPIVKELAFEQDIPKDDLHQQYIRMVQTHEMDVRLSHEFKNFERLSDNRLLVNVRNLKTKENVQIKSPIVVMAMGNSVPRSLGLTGDPGTVMRQVPDYNVFADGKPHMILGGGDTAIEHCIGAVRAKKKAKDKSEIYLCYRGRELRRVSSSLYEELGEAITSGQVYYYRETRPLYIRQDEHGIYHLGLRTEDSQRDSSPNPAERFVCIEFPLDHVVACIGTEKPTHMLQNGCGVKMQKESVILNKNFESHSKGVYVIGDILSNRYILAGDLNDPSTYKEVRHVGNIKQAYIDGVALVDSL
jgi:thioredoxin reductase